MVFFSKKNPCSYFSYPVEEMASISRNPRGSFDSFLTHHMQLSFSTSKYLPLFYIATATSQVKILIISYQSSQMAALIYVQQHFVPTMTDAQVIFLKGKTDEVNSLHTFNYFPNLQDQENLQAKSSVFSYFSPFISSHF